MMYLLIENKGEAPVESFTLLGMSTARSSEQSLIGKFGSGTKYSVNLLLRKGIEFHVYCGRTRLEFFYKPSIVDDGLSKTEVQRVYCRAGTRTLDLGWVLDFGEMDWTDPYMACREFVSNAIDRTLREGNDLSTVRVEAEPTRRARSGYTRIYIKMTEEINKFYLNRSKHFLHLVDPNKAKQTFLDKDESSPPVIYREGVFVRNQRGNQPSVFDYNFDDKSIKIDESRNSSDYAGRTAIAMAICQAQKSTLVTLFNRLTKNEVYEGDLDPYYLRYAPNPAWKEAWEAVAGDAVMASPEQLELAEFAKRKGHKVKFINSKSFVSAASQMNVRTLINVLSESESEGKEPLPATPAAQAAVNWVWDRLEKVNLTNGKTPPKVACFRSIMNGGGETFGFYENGTVFLREDISSDNNKYLTKTAVEEVAHHVTQATDNSRDFQNYLIDLIVELAA